MFSSCDSNSGRAPATRLLQDAIVDVACGECQFQKHGEGCDLAIRYQGTAYFVVGSTIDDHGDAHAPRGLCNCVRKAKVTGEVKNGEFHAKKIELVSELQSQD